MQRDERMVKGMKQLLYTILQFVWGLPQTLLGFVLYLCWYQAPHSRYHGAIVTEWKKQTGLSLGLFLFVPEGEIGKDFLVHEYGHTIQSLVLGPLYLPVIGLPSAVWCNLPCCAALRRRKKISYQSFFTERSANKWGEKATGERAKL